MYCGPLWHLISNLGSKYARDLFLVSNQRFFGMGNHLTFIWTEKSITWCRGCRRPKTVSRSEIVTLVLNMVETCFCCHTRGFLGPYSWQILTDGNRYWQTKVTISLLEVVLGLLEPLHCVLDLHIDLQLLKMVSNYFPYQKTLRLTPTTSLEHVQNQSYNFTPWRHPWPPTAPEHWLAGIDKIWSIVGREKLN